MGNLLPGTDGFGNLDADWRRESISIWLVATWKSRDIRYRAAVKGIADIKRAPFGGPPFFECTP
jgi:hypothetical protein